MTPSQLRTALDELGLSQEAAGRFLGHGNGRQVRRWLSGQYDVPKPVAMLLALMIKTGAAVDDVDTVIRPISRGASRSPRM